MVIGVHDPDKELRSVVFSAFEYGPAMHGLDGEEEAAPYSQHRAGMCPCYLCNHTNPNSELRNRFNSGRQSAKDARRRDGPSSCRHCRLVRPFTPVTPVGY
jgi:hypothetical protein